MVKFVKKINDSMNTKSKVVSVIFIWQGIIIRTNYTNGHLAL